MSTFSIPSARLDLIHSLDVDSVLDLFARQYFQLIPLGQLHWPGSDALRPLKHQEWLYRHLFATQVGVGIVDAGSTPLYSHYRPPVGYQVKVLKELVDRILASFTNHDEDVSFKFAFLFATCRV